VVVNDDEEFGVCFTRKTALMPQGVELRLWELINRRTLTTKTIQVAVVFGPRPDSTSEDPSLRIVSRRVTVRIDSTKVPNPFLNVPMCGYFRFKKCHHRLEYSCVTPRPAHTMGVNAQEGTFNAAKRSKELCKTSLSEGILRLAGNPAIRDPTDPYSHGKGWMRTSFELYRSTAMPTQAQV